MPGGLKTIASRDRRAARVTSRSCSASPPPASIVVARAADRRVDAGALLKQLVARFGGKGGGRPELAQGGGLDGAGADLVSAARSLIQDR